MQTHLEEAISEQFPFMRQGLSIGEQETQWGGIRDLYGAFGLDVGDGWYQLIREMCAEITAAYEAAGREVDIVVDQVKEKYGTLRFYYHHEDQETAIRAFDCLPGSPSLRIQSGHSSLHQKVAEIVDKYEERSAYVCEVCGQPGILRTDLDWVLTLCDEHYQPKKETVKPIRPRRRFRLGAEL